MTTKNHAEASKYPGVAADSPDSENIDRGRAGNDSHNLRSRNLWQLQQAGLVCNGCATTALRKLWCRNKFFNAYPNFRLADRGLASAVAFYDWVRQHTNRRTVMLNLGAGGPAPRDRIRVFKGEVARVAGADIDPEVMHNPELDDAQVISPGATLPFADETFDLVLSDWVVEHIDDPDRFLSEVARVLRKDGSFFFRTPNKHHYVGLLASMTPHWFHELVANRARGMNIDDHEPWPTYYRLNSRQAIELAGRRAGFNTMEVRVFEGPPVYLVFNSVPFVLGVGYERLVNRYTGLEDLRANIFARLVK